VQATWISQGLLWGAVVVLGFLVLGLIRQLALLRWRLEQLSATTPSRIGRDGLRLGTRAPAFTLERVGGGTFGLGELAGRRHLVVFTQPGCGPCSRVMPALNALERKGETQVVAVCEGDPEETAAWVEEHAATFPVLRQERREVSRRYEVLATPFAFLIDEEGVVAAKGIVNDDQHVRFLLESARDRARREPRLEAVS